jgi:hypothetical protein
MDTLIGIIVGLVGGYLVHAMSMQVSFKQRTIDNKIKVYDQLITQWVKMRNFIVANQYLAGQQQIPANVRSEFDLLYSQGLTYIGEAYLICGDVTLAKDLDDLNEKLYRAQWLQMTIQGSNGALDQLKVDAVALLVRMQADIRGSTRLSLGDISFMFSGRERIRGWRWWPRKLDSVSKF